MSQVFNLMESVELIVRRHLNIEQKHTFISGTDVKKCILEEVMKADQVLTCWEVIASTIPTKYELYSIELLKVITELWITIRGHSFSKEWTMKFERKYKKGTRKTLMPRTVDNKK